MGGAFYVGSNAKGSEELKQTMMQLFLQDAGGMLPGVPPQVQQRMNVFAMAMSGDKRMIGPLRDELNKTEAKLAGAPESEVLLVADKRTNSVLVSGDELERARMRKLIQHLDTPLEQSGNVKVVYLEYASAPEIAEVLSRVMQNISKLEGNDAAKRPNTSTATIEADEGTNALIITANTGEMQSLEAVIQRLDIRRAQVLVEAIIAELEVIDGQDLGIQWLFRNDNGAFGSNVVDGNNRAQGIADGLFPPEISPGISAKGTSTTSKSSRKASGSCPRQHTIRLGPMALMTPPRCKYPSGTAAALTS